MVNAIQQILSGPTAFAQDIDGAFYIFTNYPTKNQQLAPLFQTQSPSFSAFYSPTFFAPSAKDAFQNYQSCYKIGRPLLMEAAEGLLFGHTVEKYPQWQQQSQSDFQEDFAQIQSAMAEGLLVKAVIMTSESSHWTPSYLQRLQMLVSLLKQCPRQLFIYGYWNDERGVLGATPEILFHRQHNVIHTMALAGTFPKSSSQSAIEDLKVALLDNSKERHEHQLVIDDLFEKLSQFADHLDNSKIKPKVEPTTVIELPHLLHLCTHLRMELPFENQTAATLDELLSRTFHPSSALGLRSKTTPWSWLKKLNGHKNLGHFGAPVGFATDNGYLCLVGIRNLEWYDHMAYVRAGCGLVSQSQPSLEWQELNAKRQSVKALLGLLNDRGECTLSSPGLEN